MQACAASAPAAGGRVLEELHPDVAEALGKRGIDRLWAHQAEALHSAWAGPTIVTTGTASGKSLCFNLPTLDVLRRDARARALYLYPTKALAQDQARALNVLGVGRARPAIYDGDTPREQRSAIRRRSNIVINNPDMLHSTLPTTRRGATSSTTWRWSWSTRRTLHARVRPARRQREAPAADRGRLRDRAAVSARLRHGRQSRRARGAADRPRRHHGRRPRRHRRRSGRSRCGTRRSWTSRSSRRGGRCWPRPSTCSPSS